ncbi:threonine/serine ThrE exporter family protein [Trujillonella humicola]|uniref:threonine/serine ThrE exporter family protein n=1 Tax=Trujillonella humicola TaxID=3383699 RepID=UPI003905B1EB
MDTARPGQDEAQRVLDLTLAVGEVLLAGGVGAAAVTDVCTAVARAGGLRRVECDITFTSIALSAVPAGGSTPVSAIRLVHAGELDHTRVTGVHVLVEDFVAGRIPLSAAEERFSRVTAAPSPYRRPVVTCARAVLAASVAVLLGAGPVVTGAAFGATVVIDVVNARLGRAGLPPFFLNVTGGLLATAVALALVAAEAGVRPALVVAGGIVLLLPGVTLVGAVQDAITGFYVTAAARALETVLLTAGIVSGIAVALAVGVRLGLPVRIVDPPAAQLGRVVAEVLAAAVVATAFALANRAPARALPAVAALGAGGWGLSLSITRLELPAVLAAASAAVAIGAAGHLLAGWQRMPTVVHTVAGVVPLLPGLTIYRGMRHLAEGDDLGGMELLGSAVTTGLALAAGLILGELVVRLARRRPLRPPGWRRGARRAGAASAGRGRARLPGSDRSAT